MIVGKILDLGGGGAAGTTAYSLPPGRPGAVGPRDALKAFGGFGRILSGFLECAFRALGAIKREALQNA